jgi:hypothetical protein
MQDPALFTSQESFVKAISAAVASALSRQNSRLDGNSGTESVIRRIVKGFGNLASRSQTDLQRLISQLGWADKILKSEKRRLLLALDEYESIDTKIGEQVFSPELLATIRESIQTHRSIVWIFAGSHAIDELTHASWTSYLVSARTLEVPMFTREETTELLTEPVQWSPLWERNDPARPRFTPETWGPNGIKKIHDETGGWPHLVQLVAETTVGLLNQQGRRDADDELLQRVFERVVISGDTVLRELIERESRLPGEWAYLRAFRDKDIQLAPEDEAVERSLRRRLLIDIQGKTWRLRVPLMERWLRTRG